MQSGIYRNSMIRQRGKMLLIICGCVLLVAVQVLYYNYKHKSPNSTNNQTHPYSSTWEAHLDYIPTNTDNYLIHIIHATDANLVQLVLVSIFSILETAHDPDRLRFHIVNTGPIGSIRQDWITGCFPHRSQQIEIIHWNGEKHLENVNMHGGRADLRNAANFARFYFDDIFPALDRLIYLDADTLAIRPIDRLWAIDLKNTPLAMSVECGGWFDKLFNQVFNASHPLVRDVFSKNSENCYPNAGMLLMDQRSVTGFRLRERVENMIKANSEDFVYASGSQAPLVLSVWNNFTRLPETWNTRTKRVIRGAHILHFTGPAAKRWLAGQLDDISSAKVGMGSSSHSSSRFKPDFEYMSGTNKRKTWKKAAVSLAGVCNRNIKGGHVNSPFHV